MYSRSANVRSCTHPEVVAILISDNQQSAEGLGIFQRHGGGGVQLGEACDGCDKGVAQHVHAEQAGYPHSRHQSRQAQINRRACMMLNHLILV